MALPAGPALAADDAWLGADKVKHFGVSAVLGAAAVHALRNDANQGRNAFALAMVPGIAKEFHDARPGGTGFSGKDLAADAAGAAVGVAIGQLLLGGDRRGPVFVFGWVF